MRPPRLTSRGFTLVEVLIALVLLSIRMLSLTSAMRAMGQTGDSVERRASDADQYRTTVFFLRDVLSRVSAREFHALQAAPGAGLDASRIFFDGQPNSLAWIGVMPARFGVGGRHYLRLAMEGGGSGEAQLVLRYAPWSGAPEFADWGGAQAQVMATRVSALGLRYQRPDTGEWLSAWPPPDLPFGVRVPSAIEMVVAQEGRPWPLIIAASQPLMLTDPGVSRAQFGGGTLR